MDGFDTIKQVLMLWNHPANLSTWLLVLYTLNRKADIKTFVKSRLTVVSRAAKESRINACKF